MLKVTKEQCTVVEQTRSKQSNSFLWFQMRVRRVSLSLFKSVCHTNPSKPSISLVHSICYPEMSKLQTAATAYGCKHEPQARQKYADIASTSHFNVSFSSSCVVMSTSSAFIGAFPDGLAN